MVYTPAPAALLDALLTGEEWGWDTSIAISTRVRPEWPEGNWIAQLLAVLADRSTPCTDLLLTNFPARAIDARALAALLTGASKALFAVALCETPISDDEAAVLADALQHGQSAVTKLTLFKANVPDRGVAALLRALETNTALTVLNLSGCRIGAEGLRALPGCLQQNRSLRELLLRSEDDDGSEAAVAGLTSLFCEIADAVAANPTLDSLDLTFWPVHTSQAGHAEVWVALLACLTRNTTIGYLSVPGSASLDESHFHYALGRVACHERKTRLRCLPPLAAWVEISHRGDPDMGATPMHMAAEMMLPQHMRDVILEGGSWRTRQPG